MLSEVVAQAFHDAYERLAPSFGYSTREASAKPWELVPEENKALMVATVQALLDDGTIFVSPRSMDRDADMWRELMAPKEGLRTGTEALRRTARGAVEDWLKPR